MLKSGMSRLLRDQSAALTKTSLSSSAVSFCRSPSAGGSVVKSTYCQYLILLIVLRWTACSVRPRLTQSYAPALLLLAPCLASLLSDSDLRSAPLLGVPLCSRRTVAITYLQNSHQVNSLLPPPASYPLSLERLFCLPLPT